jgi:hypothetical protein
LKKYNNIFPPIFYFLGFALVLIALSTSYFFYSGKNKTEKETLISEIKNPETDKSLSLSLDAEYPTPVIQLQQVMSTALKSDDNDPSDNDPLVSHDSQINQGITPPEIQTLRHRLKHIKNINRLK